MRHFSSLSPTAPSPRHLLLIGALLLIPALVAACTVSVDTTDTPSQSELKFDGPALVADAMPVTENLPAEANYELHRLKVQIDYLTEELDLLSRQSEAMEDMPFIAKQQIRRRAELLQSMYMQRLESYETLKLEAETERRLKSDKSYQKMRAVEMQAREESILKTQRAQMLGAEIKKLDAEIARRSLELVQAQAANLPAEDLKRAMLRIEELNARMQVLMAESNR